MNLRTSECTEPERLLGLGDQPVIMGQAGPAVHRELGDKHQPCPTWAPSQSVNCGDNLYCLCYLTSCLLLIWAADTETHSCPRAFALSQHPSNRLVRVSQVFTLKSNTLGKGSPVSPVRNVNTAPAPARSFPCPLTAIYHHVSHLHVYNNVSFFILFLD